MILPRVQGRQENAKGGDGSGIWTATTRSPTNNIKTNRAEAPSEVSDGLPGINEAPTDKDDPTNKCPTDEVANWGADGKCSKVLRQS